MKPPNDEISNRNDVVHYAVSEDTTRRVHTTLVLYTLKNFIEGYNTKEKNDRTMESQLSSKMSSNVIDVHIDTDPNPSEKPSNIPLYMLAKKDKRCPPNLMNDQGIIHTEKMQTANPTTTIVLRDFLGKWETRTCEYYFHDQIAEFLWGFRH